MKRLVLIAMALAIFVSCKKTEPVGTAAEGGTQLAKVDSVVITDKVVKEEFDMLPKQVQEMFLTEGGGMQEVVDELVKKELLYVEARNKGFDKEAAFTRRVEDFRKRLMIERLLEEEIEKKAAVSDQEVKQYYEENKKNFIMEAPGGGKGKPVEFERVKPLIEQRLNAERQKTLFDDFVASLKKTHKVELDRDAIAKAFGAPSKGEAPSMQGKEPVAPAAPAGEVKKTTP